MDKTAKENLFNTFKAVIDSVIADKKENPKNLKLINNFNAKVNIGLHVEEDEIFYVNLVAKDGNYELSRGQLDDYDLGLIAAPEDLMFFSNGENSTVHMIMKKNQFGKRKLRLKKGGRNIGKLLKISKILVLDKRPAGG